VVRFLLDCDLIPLQQHGFLPGKSIQSNLLACLADWTREVDNGNSVDVLYLDFSKAFDRVPKRQLQHLGISGNLLAWINAFLSERTFCVRVGESYSLPVRVHSGVPQGSVLRPLLFIAYTADLRCILRSPFAMYADDIKVYNISNQSMALEQDLLAIHDWSCDWLLPLNSDKCGVLHIGNTNPKHIYRINGKELASFDNYRDLGVTVSFDLSWSNHILKITKKANSMLFLLNKVFRKSNPAIFAKLYKTYVRPVLEFANCVWTPVLQRDCQLLESVQRRATRVPFGRSRPQYTARLSLMGIPSLSARRVRGDLLVVSRALPSEQSPIRHLFTLHEGGRTSGHSLKLLKDRFVTTARQYFLTNRIFDQWNSLPPEIVNCKTADSFKAKYDSLLKSRPPDGP
jgi:ribonuclease P/MRP protein subunit RPP40